MPDPNAGLPPRYLRTPEAARFLSLSGRTLEKHRTYGTGPAYRKLGGRVVYALEDLKARLAADPRDAEAILDAASITPPEAPILAQRGDIDRLFAAETLEEILAALAADDGEWAQAELAGLRTKSFQSCKVALRLLRDGAARTDFADEMRAEYGLAAHVSMRHDFIEGVRALLIDKDNAPIWDPATPEGVTDKMLDTIFAPLPPGEEWEPLRL